MRTLLFMSLLSILIGCVDERERSIGSSRDFVDLNFAVEIPDAILISSRADESTIDELMVLLFNEEGGFEGIYSATINGANYSVTLPAMSERSTLHFVANYDWSEFDVAEYIGANEGEVVASLQSDNICFWQRIVLESGVMDDALNGGVSLLRSVAKFTLDLYDDSGLSDVAFALYNIASIGTVAPFNTSTYSFESIVTEASGATFDSLSIFGTTSIYIFERENSSVTDDPTYIIVRGQLNGVLYYYKLDIISDEGVAYDIERNVWYNIMVERVEGVGYTTLDEARSSPASNNILASVVMQDFPTVTDGEYTLSVDKTSYAFTANNQRLAANATYRSVDGEYLNEQIELTLIQDEAEVVVVGELSYDELTGDITAEIADLPDDGVEYTATIKVSAGSLQRTISLSLHSPLHFYDEMITPKGISAAGDVVTLLFSIPDIAEYLLPFDCYITTSYLTPEAENIEVEIVNGTYRYVWEATSVGEQSISLTANRADASEVVYIDADLFEQSQVAYYNGSAIGNFSAVSFNPNPVPFGVGESVTLYFTVPWAGVYYISTENLLSTSGNIINGVYTHYASSAGAQQVDFITLVESSQEMVTLSADQFSDYEIELKNPLIYISGTIYYRRNRTLSNSDLELYIDSVLVANITTDDSGYFEVAISAALGDELVYSYGSYTATQTITSDQLTESITVQ